MGQWGFSSRRVNGHLLELLGKGETQTGDGYVMNLILFFSIQILGE